MIGKMRGFLCGNPNKSRSREGVSTQYFPGPHLARSRAGADRAPAAREFPGLGRPSNPKKALNSHPFGPHTAEAGPTRFAIRMHVPAAPEPRIRSVLWTAGNARQPFQGWRREASAYVVKRAAGNNRRPIRVIQSTQSHELILCAGSPFPVDPLSGHPVGNGNRRLPPPHRGAAENPAPPPQNRAQSTLEGDRMLEGKLTERGGPPMVPITGHATARATPTPFSPESRSNPARGGVLP